MQRFGEAVTLGADRAFLRRARRATRNWLRGALHRRRGSESGFTLIELITVVAILPIVIGGISIALLSVFNLQDSVSNRVGDSNDELVSSAYFNKDVQSAQQIQTTNNPVCGSTGQQLLGLEWGLNTTTATYETVVSYVQTTTGTTTSLVRNVCTSGASATPTSSDTIGHDVGNPTVALNPTSFSSKTNQGWTSTQGLFGVTLNIDAPGSGYSYALSGLPSAGASTGSASQVVSNEGLPGCNLANPGTGTYANILCFADFSSFLSTFTSPSATCTQMKFSIADTSDLLQFCLSVTPNNQFPGGVTAEPQGIPTYDNVAQGGNSEPYLGNNGFYQGIQGEPAISQRPQPQDPCSPCTFAGANSALTTLTFTDIEVTNANGEAATGWTLVTGDAESTDSNEWNIYTNTTSPTPVDWEILPNSTTSLYGNTCYDTADSASNGLFAYKGPVPPTDTTVGSPTNGLSGDDSALTVSASQPYTPYTTNAASVGCEADTQLDKTGTLMLAAPEPTGSYAPQSLSISMQGGGYQAVFVGVLL
jgi:prepilin-type N-terminal cleavage/methylation domain-containing protein